MALNYIFRHFLISKLKNKNVFLVAYVLLLQSCRLGLSWLDFNS